MVESSHRLAPGLDASQARFVSSPAHPLHIFPDTNLLLHFERLDRIDWCGLTGAEAVTLVLAPVVVRELDRHKNEGRVRRLQDRAREISSWLRALRRDGAKVLDNGAGFEIAVQETSDFYGNGLSPDVPDDRLIVCATDYVAQAKPVAVATDDTLLLHKLDAYGLRAIELPERLRRKSEPDPVEVENKQLRQKLSALESRTPALELQWATGDASWTLTFPPADSGEIASPAELTARYPLLPRRGERPPGLAGVAALHLATLPDSTIDRHNERLAKFHQDYAAYYAKAAKVLAWRRSHVRFKFSLNNAGTGSARHVLVAISMPEGIKPILRSKADGPEMPTAPEPPGPPSPFGLESALDLSRSWMRPDVSEQLRRSLRPLDPEPFELDRQRAVVRFDRALPGHAELLPALDCLVHPDCVGKTLSVRVEIFAEELTGARSQTLTLTVD